MWGMAGPRSQRTCGLSLFPVHPHTVPAPGAGLNPTVQAPSLGQASSWVRPPESLWAGQRRPRPVTGWVPAGMVARLPRPALLRAWGHSHRWACRTPSSAVAGAGVASTSCLCGGCRTGLWLDAQRHGCPMVSGRAGAASRRGLSLVRWRRRPPSPRGQPSASPLLPCLRCPCPPTCPPVQAPSSESHGLAPPLASSLPHP